VTRRERLVRALAAALLALGLAPTAVSAQVFIASKPRPEFWIAPLFITANIRQEDVAEHPGPLTLQVSFSVAPPPARDPADIAQDIYLLWPGELTGTAGADGADPVLARQVENAGFKVLAHGRAPLSARSRAQMGTGAGAAGRRSLGEAPFVTFARPEGLARGARAASYIRIPWKPELASLDWLARLELPVKGAITPRRVSWLEETFWGRRHILTTGFGDLGPPALGLFGLYYERRDRIVHLAREYAMVIANFGDSDHLKIEEISPPSAVRRPSRVRAGAEVVALSLLPSQDSTAQSLRVQFHYFSGRINWRPIVISAVILLVTNFAGVLMLSTDVTRRIRRRRRRARRRPTEVRAAGRRGAGVPAGRGAPPDKE